MSPGAVALGGLRRCARARPPRGRGAATRPPARSTTRSPSRTHERRSSSSSFGRLAHPHAGRRDGERRELRLGARPQHARPPASRTPASSSTLPTTQQRAEPDRQRQERHEQQPRAEAHRSTYPTPRIVSTASGAPIVAQLAPDARDVGVERVVVHDRAVGPGGRDELARGARPRPAARPARPAARNSVGVSATLASPSATACAAGSSTQRRPAAARLVGGRARRSSAWTRTSSSASANGLVEVVVAAGVEAADAGRAPRRAR